jgi:hypothetical protein
MRRDWWMVAAALLSLALMAGLAAVGVEMWASLYPRSPRLAQATYWPYVGDWIGRVRDRHLGPTAARTPARYATAPTPPPPATDAFATREPVELPPGVWPEVWLDEGDALRERPSSEAPVVIAVSAIANVGVLEARGEWRRVRFHGSEGWVREKAGGAPPLGSAVEPVRPVSGRPAEPRLLAAARDVLANAGVADPPARRLGPYPLLTDVDEPALFLLLDRAARGIEGAYRSRYGIAPTGEAAETVVLFRRKASYEDYLRITGGPHAETGHVAGGVVAFYREGRLLDDVRTTFVHELVHALGRRAIGPALPPWLDEGMADDLGESRIGEGAQVVPGTLGGTTLRAGGYYEQHGGEASRELLRRQAASDGLMPLARLVALDDVEFHTMRPPGLAYAHSSFFVRMLLDGDLAPRFQAFLRSVADGGPATPEALVAALGRSWEELDAALAARALAAPATGPGEAAAPTAPPPAPPPALLPPQPQRGM